ncbi:MAG: hypothetical protein IT438_13010 [Phycisphaerales bacterium]|nr:hypothetical protein [Phycisphaerales bacterium]
MPPDPSRSKTVTNLPSVRSPLAPQTIVERLDAAARRGKLPGWRSPGPAARSSGTLFELTDFARPFEHTLRATADRYTGGTSLRFDIRPKPTLPVVYLIVLVVTVWPGVWLTNSMLRSYFTGYDWKTWMWYLPLTVPFIPLALVRAWRKSRHSAHAEALELIGKVAGAIEGQIEGAAAEIAPTPRATTA